MSDRFTQEEVDRVVKWKFEGMADAMRLMNKRPPGTRFVGRWDWHLWMFLVSSCLPCFGIYCLAMWVRKGEWEKHKKMQEMKIVEEKDAPPTLEQLMIEHRSMRQEIEKLKLVMLLQSRRHPSLPPEQLRKWIRLRTDAWPSTEEEEKAPTEEKKASWGDRMWNKIKRWLPFYVEPFFVPDERGPPRTDFSAIMKPNKPPN